jgi:large subunit ribosomal protein L22
MQARARVKYLKMSPRKMRRVAALIKGKRVQDAINILNFTPKAAAHHLAKTVKAAAANAISGVGTSKLKAEDLAISKILIDQAPTAKRIRFQSMGRIFRVRKRYCHLTIEVEGEPAPETKGRDHKKKLAEEKVEAGDKATKGSGKKTKAKVEEKIEEPVVETTETAKVEPEEGKSEA